ncbi:methyl-accepting chemotaxis protein [Paracidovorax wautersii]|uniref:Methyl-accepting chemotaxis protein-1 (Serine sensor receptor) n=1 Tax=Paracidovorax wautersii TaxID=1177982 RepID=A0ABU1I853_9BURK|nr:methyl-accepting chemotaxis protein [Paracidovorax wautersii]MDR6213406.1 methyl-accepting chemotaxis protein-1 (serine sensor receptor) [Paracidovorax wautersii]
MFRNISVRAGLLLVLAFFTGALLVAIGVGWTGTRSGVEAFESQRQFSQIMLTLKQAEIRMWDNRVALAVGHRNLLRGDAKPSIRGQTDRADKAMTDAQAILEKVVREMPAEYTQDRQSAQAMLTAFKAYDGLVRRGSKSLAEADGADYSAKEIVDQRNKLLAEIESLMKGLFDSAEARDEGLYQQTLQLQRVSQNVAGVLVLLGLGLAIGCWVFINRQILHPLRDAGALLERVAEGDLTQRVEVSSGNEIGRLLASLRKMQDGLVRMVVQVRQGVQEINTGAQEIALGNSDLSGRTEQQAASLEETAASMEELSSTVKQNADSARQANQLAAGSMDVAQRGGAVVQDVVVTMQAISGSSKKIAEIVNVIDSIAFQTNILALNAAVEAARAGEQGRGFAVVASEVRALAQRSASAAKEIKDLIGDSVGKVNAGSEQVERAGATMREIVASVQRVTDIMGEISAASQEQSSGIDQVNQAVAQMDQATQQNAALVEQAAAAASSLDAQAKQLQQAVSQFRVAAADSQGLAAPAAPVAAPHRAAPVRKPATATAPAPAPKAMPRAAAAAPAAPAIAAPLPAKAASAPAAAPRPAAPPPAVKPASRSDDDWETF